MAAPSCEKPPRDDDSVPVLRAEGALREKMSILAEHFRCRFDVEPSFFVRIPGRVNLIGEHIDYCGYPVFPMAIQQFIIVAVAVSENNELALTNFTTAYADYHYKDFNSISDKRICISDDGPAWHQYFLCGVKGILEFAPKMNLPKGMLAAVWGNIPVNSGLSSSSALVSAAALSTAQICQFSLSKDQLATMCATAERYIGTQGGGMDQAIVFLGKAGSAKLIEFNPLRATDVMLPQNAVFLIAHSLVYHNKASTSDFNLRVMECKLAAQVIAKKHEMDWRKIQNLIDIQDAFKKDLEGMAKVVTTDLKEEPYAFNEICEILGVSSSEWNNLLIKSCFAPSQEFKLRNRALHVFKGRYTESHHDNDDVWCVIYNVCHAEAARVIAFREVNEDPNIFEDDKISQIGSLMSESHASLRKLYECSHPQVDALVDAAIECGALGAKLTGAGWGGCVVAVTTRANVDRFVHDLKKKFYKDRDLRGANLDDLIFRTKPCQGAAIYIS